MVAPEGRSLDPFPSAPNTTSRLALLCSPPPTMDRAASDRGRPDFAPLEPARRGGHAGLDRLSLRGEEPPEWARAPRARLSLGGAASAHAFPSRGLHFVRAGGLAGS